MRQILLKPCDGCWRHQNWRKNLKLKNKTYFEEVSFSEVSVSKEQEDNFSDESEIDISSDGYYYSTYFEVCEDDENIECSSDLEQEDYLCDDDEHSDEDFLFIENS